MIHAHESDRGSAPAEFVLVSVLLLTLTLAVLQLGAVFLVRNTALDAAAEGARWAALDGSTPAQGAARTREILTTALGAGYARDVTASTVERDGRQVAEVTATIPLPVIGLIGPPSGIRVAGHAVVEPAP